MIKEELVNYYRHIAGKTDQTRKYHPLVVAKAISGACNTIIYETFAKSIARNIDLYSKTFLNVPIAYESSTDSYYSFLPAPIIQLPTVGDGVRNVLPMKGESITFIPVSGDTAGYFLNMEVGNIINHVGYTVYSDRVVYVTNSTLLGTITSVKMRLVRPFEAYDDTEEFYIPAGQDDRLEQLVLSKLGLIRPDNLKNDNNGNIK